MWVKLLMKIKVGIQSQTLYSRAYKGIDLCSKASLLMVHYLMQFLLYSIHYHLGRWRLISCGGGGKLVGAEKEGVWGELERRGAEKWCAFRFNLNVRHEFLWTNVTHNKKFKNTSLWFIGVSLIFSPLTVHKPRYSHTFEKGPKWASCSTVVDIMKGWRDPWRTEALRGMQKASNHNLIFRKMSTACAIPYATPRW